MKVALYARVSRDEQNIEDQIDKLKTWAEDKGHDYDLYSEKASSVKERPEFEKLKGEIDGYDALVVRDLDRFGRTTRDVLKNIDELTDKGVAFRCLDQPILNTNPGEEETPLQQAMRQLMAVFAEFERKMIRKRLEAGYEQARKEGRVGRPKKLNPEQEQEVWKMYDEKDYSMVAIRDIIEGRYGIEISKYPIQRIINERRDS